jgi:peptide/nickel transport system permease protein
MKGLKKIKTFFNRNKSFNSRPFYIICVFLFISFFHPFIANERPLYAKASGESYFPVIRSIGENLHLLPVRGNLLLKDDYDFKIMPLIPYSYNTIDRRNGSYVSPFMKQDVDNIWQRHWLGTDVLGRDVFAGLLKGTEVAIKIGFLSVFIGFLIASFLGLFAAYYQRFPLQYNFLDLILLLIWIGGLIYFFWFGVQTQIIRFFVFFILSGIMALSYAYIKKVFLHKFLKNNIRIPVDGMLMRILEAMKAIPLFIFLLACITLLENVNTKSLIIILGFLIWPGFTRYIRAEALKVLSQDYITAAKAYGASGYRILIVHVFPKIFTSLSVIIAFGISSVILIESTLSFLGIGIPIEDVSWGSMLKEAKTNFSAWWMAIFPGFALFLLILNLNLLGEDLEMDFRAE